MAELEPSSIRGFVGDARLRSSHSPSKALGRFCEACLRSGFEIGRLLSEASEEDV